MFDGMNTACVDKLYIFYVSTASWFRLQKQLPWNTGLTIVTLIHYFVSVWNINLLSWLYRRYILAGQYISCKYHGSKFIKIWKTNGTLNEKCLFRCGRRLMKPLEKVSSYGNSREMRLTEESAKFLWFFTLFQYFPPKMSDTEKKVVKGFLTFFLSSSKNVGPVIGPLWDEEMLGPY